MKILRNSRQSANILKNIRINPPLLILMRIDMDKITPIISAIMELNNKADPCPCGSGLKYKKCCGKIVN